MNRDLRAKFVCLLLALGVAPLPLGALPFRKSEVLEPRAARKVAFDTDYDGLGRPVETREAGGTYVTRMSYDEAGNTLSLQTPGLPFAFMSYDARGLMWRQQLPSGDIVRRTYDERGTLRQYIDEEGRVTFYDTDGLGRVFRIRYPDGTSEESRFENGTGVLLASRDRAGQWIWFEYDDQHNGRLLAEHLGGTGSDPTLTPDPFAAYDYDDAGRVKRIRNAEAGVEFDAFDLLGRPQVTRAIRYKKTGCIPSLTPCGSGLTTTPAIAEIYTQGHEWNVFDERDRWRMPVVGSALPADAVEADTPWRNWIEEQRDGGANVVRQGESVSRTSAAVSFLEASARGMGRPAERKRTASTPATELLTRYGYADAADSGTSAVVPVSPVTPGPPSGALGRHEVRSATTRIAGTEVTLGVNQRIERIEDLGLDERESKFDYDDRGRLGNTILLRRDGDSANQPVANSIVQPAGFLEARSIAPPRLSPTEFGLLGVMATSVVPVTWTADAPTAGGQITHRSFTNGPAAAGDQSFTWTGGRRTGSGSWNVTYDARGRLTSAEGTDRRIEYDYDPMDRLVGRIALQKDATDAWTLETRSNVLARDGLPASATFVWDPIVDRLIAVYDSAVVTSATTATTETGLVRQYIHGDQGYDDPVEVLIAWTAGAIPSRYLPIIDEAGSGSLQAVADGDGNLVERVVYADAYGDAPRYLQGAVVEHIRNDINDGTRTLTVKFSEAIDASTLADGLRLAARDSAGNVLRALAVTPTLDAAERIATWTIDETTWTAFSDAAASIQFSVTPTLRFRGWGATPLQPAAPWETILGRANASPAFPFYKNLTRSDLASDGVLYDLPDLHLAARPESRTQLLFDFHALPLRDPATSLSYVRARWYDASTGSFLTPDPMGYEDASNLYAYAGNDPITMRDPTGEIAIVDNLIGGAVSLGLGWGIAKLTGQEYTATDALIDFSIGAATSGISAIEKFGKLGKLGMWALREGMEVGVDVAAESIRRTAKGEDYTFSDIASGAAKNWAIGKGGAVVGRYAGGKFRSRRVRSTTGEAREQVGDALEATAVAKEIEVKDVLATRPPGFVVDLKGLAASTEQLRALARAREAGTLAGATPNTIGDIGEDFLGEITHWRGTPQFEIDLGPTTRRVDRRLGTVNLEVKNTSRRQSNSRFFRQQIRKERMILRRRLATSSILIGTRGFTRRAAENARRAGVEVVDLEDFPDIRHFPFK